MTTSKPKTRITDELLDQIVGEADRTDLFERGEFMAALRRTLAEQLLDAERDVP